jgi:hypothetical protein
VRASARAQREVRAQNAPRRRPEKKSDASKKTLTKNSSTFTFRDRKEVTSAMAAKKGSKKSTTKKSSSKKTTKKGKK